MRIVFMGTPDFAVGSLEALINAGHEIAGVFTQPDKPQGRKMVPTAPPVKRCAEAHGLKVFQPESVKKGDALNILRSLAPELIAVVAYGKILPQEILDLPKYGCVNVHASVLPKYRGASPIQWAIFCGEHETGVTTMLMDSGMDTGDILLCEKTNIENTDDYSTLHDRLAAMGAVLLTKTVTGLENGSITPVKQPESGVTYAPIIKKEMGRIDFEKTAEEIDCQIRAFSPWPSAYLYIGDLRVKVISAEVGDNGAVSPGGVPGTVIASKDALTIACKGGTCINFTVMQPEGRGAMSAKALLNGHPVAVGTVL